MADHTNEGHLDHPSEEMIPTKDAEASNTYHAPEHIEAHHYARHGGKRNWKSYFWEFLMLFLAVFAGFLAENQREQFVENQREKKFARRLLSDARQDSIFFETRIHLLEARQQAHERFLKIMTNPVPPTDSALMREFVPLLTGTNNDFTTATYDEMKTSGSLLYIDNDKLTTSLQAYYDVLLAKISRDSEGANQFFTDYIISYMTKHFRFQDFKSSDGSSLHIKLLNRSPESDQELINIMGVWASNCDTQLDLLRPAQQQMLELIKLLKKEYRLK